jgi:ribosomal protein S18 acetylase RimI-like enzyme
MRVMGEHPEVYLNKMTSGNTFKILTATWHDFRELNQIEKTCFRPEDVWPFLDLIGILTLPGLIRLKAVDEAQMVGFVGGERKPQNRLGWVTTLAVLPDHRHRGIGRALLDACEAALATPAIRLSVRASNQSARVLYEHAGYRLVDRWRGYYAGGEDALVFEKKR